MLSLKYKRVDYFGELECRHEHTLSVCPCPPAPAFGLTPNAQFSREPS